MRLFLEVPPSLTSVATPSQWGDGLLRQTEELRRRVQAKDDVLVKMEKEREPLKQAAGGRLEILHSVSEVRRSCGLSALKECPR